MKPKTVLINILFLFLGYINYAQEIPKDTIYLEFNKYLDCKYKGLPLKWQKKKGVQFNLCGEAIFFNPKNSKPDTLCNKHLKDYKITKLKHIDSLGRFWYKKNLSLLKKKYGKYIAPHDNNGKFTTYILEKKKENFILYRVFWKNQGI